MVDIEGWVVVVEVEASVAVGDVGVCVIEVIVSAIVVSVEGEIWVGVLVDVEAWLVEGVVGAWVFVVVVSVAIAASAVVCAVEILVKSESTSEEVQVKSLIVSVSKIFTRASALVGL